MTALLMRSETTGAVWRVWPEPEPVAPGTVQETGSYLFELHGTADAATADLLVDDLPLEALRAQRLIRRAGAGRRVFTPARSRRSCDCPVRRRGASRS